MKPLVTTVIPTYQRPKFLRRAILSVLLQSYPNLQICVYDNASGDETKEVVAEIMKIDNRVKYHCHDKNIGSFNNFNYGINEVQTPFFSLLSDDDVITPLFYEEAIKAFEKFPEAMFVCLGAITVDIDNNNVLAGSAMVDQPQLFSPSEGFEGMVNGSLPGTWTAILFKRELKDEIGLIDVSVGSTADAGFVCHAAARFPFIVLPKIGGLLMAHPDSMTASASPLSGMRQVWRERIIQRIVSDKKVSPSIRLKVKEIIPKDFRKVAFYQVMKGLADGQLESAKRASIGLKECGYPLSSQLLQLLVRSYQWIPLAQPLLITLKKIRRRFQKKIKYPPLNQQYGKYLEFIKQLSALTVALEKNSGKFDIDSAKEKLAQNLQIF